MMDKVIHDKEIYILIVFFAEGIDTGTIKPIRRVANQM